MNRRPFPLLVFASCVLYCGLGGALLAQDRAPPAGEPLVAQAPASPAWAEVVPFAPRGDATVLRWSPDAEILRLPAVETGAALVCLGGEGLAIDCRQVDLAQATELEPWLAPGVAVKGHLLLGREPMAGAEIGLIGARYRLRRSYVLPLRIEGEKPVRWVAAGEDGSFELPQLAPGDYRLEVRRPGGKTELTEPFSVPLRETLLPRESGPASAEADAEAMSPEPAATARAVLDLGTLTLEPGLEVAVSVLTPTGEPLEGAKVGGIQSDGPAGAPTYYSVHTDRRGEAVITGAEAGVPLKIGCQAPGFAYHAESFPSPPTDVICMMEPLAAITGTVVAEGEPVSGATTSLYRPDGTRRPARRVSDVDGVFELTQRLAGVYRLVVAAPGFQVEERRFELAPGETLDLGEVELFPALRLQGLVVDAETGQPIPGATIFSLEPAGLVNTASNGSGRFEFTLEGPERLRLEVEAQGYPATVIDVDGSPSAGEGNTVDGNTVEGDPVEGEEDLRVELAPGGRIEALVWSEETSQPCLGCDLTYHRLRGRSEANSGAMTTGADGRAVSELLAPGPYRVVREEVTTHGTTVSVSTGDDTREATVVPRQTSRVTFGAPRGVLHVQLWPPPPAGWQVAAADARGVKTYTPDEAGRFELRRVVESAVRLRLQGTTGQAFTVSLATIPADFDDSQLDLELPETRVRGRLIGDTAEIRGSVRAVALGGSGARAWTLSEADGRFELPHLPPGSYRLQFRDRQVATFTVGPGQRLDLEAEVPATPR